MLLSRVLRKSQRCIDFAWCQKHDDRLTLRSVFLVQTTVQPRVSWRDVGYCPVLWLQERVVSGEIRIEKRKGEDNAADIGTKAVTAPVLRKHLKTLKMEWRDGRHPLTLSAAL